MAAGEGTRMHSSLPKVLHPVCGRPMVAWPILAAREAGAGRIGVIVSPHLDISDQLPEGTESFVQPQPDGTGGAIRAALESIRDSGVVVVLNGDHPLVTAEFIASVVAVHHDAGAAGTVVTVDRDDPESLGRIVRDAGGEFERSRRDQASRGRARRGAGDQRGEHKYVRLRCRCAGRRR